VIDAEIAPFYEQLVKYVNVNRIDSVVSKFPDLKDRNKLKDLVIKDILTDAEKDEVKLPENEEKHKKLLKEFNSVVLKEINSYFVKHWFDLYLLYINLICICYTLIWFVFAIHWFDLYLLYIYKFNAIFID